MSDNLWNNPYNPFQSFKTLAWYSNFKAIKTGDFLPPVNIALDIIQGTPEHKLCGGHSCNFCMSDMCPDDKVCKIEPDFLFTMPEFFNKWGVKSLCLAGNNSDPAAYNHKDLIKFLRLCKQWNIDVGFVSNGSLYSDDLLEEVARNCKWSGWSINAGTKESHETITGTKSFEKIIKNMKRMSDIIKQKDLDHKIGYKYLILPENYSDIYEGALIAREAGTRHMQIRPCELPVQRSDMINTEIVKEQIKKALTLEIPGQFEVFGIREKFNKTFRKVQPKRCIASPLGSTWKANGAIAICPDRRFSSDITLGNFITEGLEAIRRKWGGPEHQNMIKLANADIDHCIRCTSIGWHRLYEATIETDSLDITLI